MPTITASEYLTINSVPLATPAWKTVDVAPLFDSAPQRGENRVVPHANGRVAYLRRNDEWPIQLNLVIFGAYDQNGVLASNKRLQLLTNIEYLKTNVVAPTGTGDGTRTAVWTQAGGTTKTAPVHVLRLTCAQIVPGSASVRAVLELVVPAGQFT